MIPSPTYARFLLTIRRIYMSSEDMDALPCAALLPDALPCCLAEPDWLLAPPPETTSMVKGLELKVLPCTVAVAAGRLKEPACTGIST